MSINRYAILLTAFLSLAVCISCHDGRVLNEFKDVDIKGWVSDDTVSFDLPKVTRGADLKAEIGVRLSDTYTFKNLYVTATLLCEGEEMSHDTLKVDIYDTDGKSKGQGFPYTTVSTNASVVHVDSGKTYTYKISHIMSQSMLKGIRGIGLRLDVQKVQER